MIYRLIAPQWAVNKNKIPKVLEGEFTDNEIREYNSRGYNIYYLPNSPEFYTKGIPITGADITKFEYVFVDCDLKDQIYATKDTFLDAVASIQIPPTKIIDSGHGIHIYWKITNLDAMSYLRFQRRLSSLLHTDTAVGQIFQLMRHPGTLNTKIETEQVMCMLLGESEIEYSAHEFNKLLPPISIEDEVYCKQHYDKTYGINQKIDIPDTLPAKFGALLAANKEVKTLWSEPTNDRSSNDFRLGHIMFSNGFTKQEAASVLINSAKALQRAPVHRISYANNIIDKIWTYEFAPEQEKTSSIYSSIKNILIKSKDNLKGERIQCWSYIDNTAAGFRIGQVLGLVGGSGVGKTAVALNIFLGFVQSNPDLEHFFVPLEQPDKEIADRWAIMCKDKIYLHDKVHVISNYDDSGVFRDLSLDDIKQQILDFKKQTGKIVGCVVIDHIGVLCNENKLGHEEGLKKIAKAMKSFAIETSTFLIMQSQTSREKAGIGDLELDKDAAFGTSTFENFCDYLVTLWQPLKRVYKMGAPTVLSYKFCKIRHKNQKKDSIQEDTPYSVYFDSETQLLRELTQDEEKSIAYWIGQATNKRKLDRKTDVVSYTSMKWENNETKSNNKSTKH